MNAARAYIRVSTVAQSEHGISLDTQRQTIQKYADEHGLVILMFYLDVMSGTRQDRPRYQEMLADMQPGETILFFRFDRLGRKNSETFRLFEECKKRRIALVSVTEPSLSDEFARNIVALVAARESEITGERVRANLTRLAETGRWPSRKPHWYDIGPDGHLIPTPDAWQAQECWEMFLRTGNKNITASAYGLGRRQFWWMIRSPAYVGAIPWRGAVYEGSHPAIVKRETWEAARAIVEARRTGTRRERTASALLVGFIFVEGTDRRMDHRPMHSKNLVFRYYATDPDRYHLMPRHVVRADYAEGVVIDALRSLHLSSAQRKEIEATLRERRRTDPYKRERREIERRMTALETEQVNTARMVARGEIMGPVWEQMRQQQGREMGALIERKRLLPPLPDTADIAPLLDLRMHLRQDVEQAVADGNTAALRLLVEGFIARVEVWGAESPRLKGRPAAAYYAANRPRIDVKWNDGIYIISD